MSREKAISILPVELEQLNETDLQERIRQAILGGHAYRPKQQEALDPPAEKRLPVLHLPMHR